MGGPPDRIGSARPWALAAPDQMHELLRRRDIAAEFAALLGHRAATVAAFRDAPGAVPHGAPPAGRFCGSGSHCQHRCCHCPRRLSFVEEEVSNARTRTKLHGVRLSRPDRRLGSPDRPANTERLQSHGRAISKAPVTGSVRVRPELFERMRSPEFIESFPAIVSSGEGRRNNSPARRNHFPLLAQISGNSRRLSSRQRNGGDCRPRTTGDSQMRTISFILAFAFMLAGPSMAGSSDQDLPGIGTFAYNGSPVATSAPSRSLSRPISVRDRFVKKSPVKAIMFLRICSAAILSFLLFSRRGAGAGPLQTPQTSFRPCSRLPDPRGEFVRQCAPHMVGRWAHPETVCSCLHDYAAATVEDSRPARSAAARHQRDRRADHRDRTGCRRRSSPRSARPSPRSPSRRCNACSSRRRTSSASPRS